MQIHGKVDVVMQTNIHDKRSLLLSYPILVLPCILNLIPICVDTHSLAENFKAWSYSLERSLLCNVLFSFER